ncbi:hypothetical protein [Caballeronia glebae]|uniref:hypothetical protein n=1 Tax=Caballeronia glebae TaxID=1777143 RepID=UPI0038BC123F
MSKKKWRLHDYETSAGKREVRKHYERESEEVQAAFDLHWEYLEVRDRSEWVRPNAHKLRPEFKGGFRDFFEFRFKADNVQQRPLGFFGPDNGVFTLLVFATEKGSKFVPQNAYGMCCDRRETLIEGGGRSVPWDENEVDDEADKIGKTAAQGVPKRLR